MKQKITGIFLGIGLLVGLVFLFPIRKPVLGSNAVEVPGAKVLDNRATVVVELFTSEGCSSCPPADKLLSFLGTRQPVESVEIIPLSEHVDYWNRLGWTDPFSSPLFSERQREYAESLRAESYTPQMVVDGKSEFVGSDQNRALATIASELNAPRATVSIRTVAPENDSRQNSVSFSISVGDLSHLDLKGKAKMFLAVTEDNLQSNVRGGENSGRNLAHTAVVRVMKQVSTFDIKPDARIQAQTDVNISIAWKPKDLRAVVFLQHESTRRIFGSAVTAFPAL